MKRGILSILLILLVLIINTGTTLAQCAMCRSTVANNVSNGNELGLAAGLNTGILYLFAAPYLLVGLVAFFWFKNARVKQGKSKSYGV